MLRWVRSVVAAEDGATDFEYGVMLAIVLVVVGAVLHAVTGRLA